MFRTSHISSFSSVNIRKITSPLTNSGEVYQKGNMAIMLTNASLKIQSAQQSNPLHLTILQAIKHYYGRNKSNKATKMTQNKSNEAILRSKNKKQ